MWESKEIKFIFSSHVIAKYPVGWNVFGGGNPIVAMTPDCHDTNCLDIRTVRTFVLYSKQVS